MFSSKLFNQSGYQGHEHITSLPRDVIALLHVYIKGRFILQACISNSGLIDVGVKNLELNWLISGSSPN